MSDLDNKRRNERIKAISSIAGNGGLALIGGCVAAIYGGSQDDRLLIWALAGLLGVVGSVLILGWLGSED